MAYGVLDPSVEYLAGGNYSPDVIDYLNNLAAQRQALMDKYGAGLSINNPEFMRVQQVQEPASDSYSTVYPAEQDIRAIMASGQSPTAIFDPGYDVQSWGYSRDPSNFEMVRLGAGNQYTLTDKNTGQTYTASTPEQVKALPQLAKSLSGMGNNVANWDITDASGNVVASDRPYTPSFLKQAGQTIADIARDYVLPAAGAAIGGVPGAMAASFLSGTMKDQSTADILKNMGIAGATTYGMQVASPYVNSALTDAGLGGNLTDTLFSPTQKSFWGDSGTYGGSLGTTDGVESVLTGAYRAPVIPVTSAMLPAITGALSSALPVSTPSYEPPADNVERVTQTATRTPDDLEAVLAAGAAAAGIGAGAIPSGIGTTPPAAQPTTQPAMGTEYTHGVIDPNAIDPEAALAAGAAAAGIGAGAIPSGIGTTPPAAQPTTQPSGMGQEDIVVSATKAPEYYADLAATGALTAADAAAVNNLSSTAATPSDSTGMSTADKIKLGLTALGLIGGMGGASSTGAGGTGTVPTGAGVMPSSFTTAKLPSISDIPAFGGGVTPEALAPRTPADMGPIDWNRYGFGPERSFFVNVPKRATGGSMAVRKPGKSFAVRGPGDGRSDDIPAVLSDGEYVMDAETVSLLGNGSNKAGAERLDQFRANIRKHKGKELAKGRFSVNAKNPQAYMAGGRS